MFLSFLFIPLALLFSLVVLLVLYVLILTGVMSGEDY